MAVTRDERPECTGHPSREGRRSGADAFIQKVGADGKATATIYFTLKSGNLNSRVHIDAIKKADGRIVSL